VDLPEALFKMFTYSKMYKTIIIRKIQSSIYCPSVRALTLFPANESKKFQQSYVHGPSNRPLLGITMGQLLDQTAEKYGDNEAVVVVHQNTRKNYSELRAEVDQLAAGLMTLNLNRGDPIGIWGSNSYEWILTQWAASRAGLILVCINPAYQPLELKYALNKVGVKALVASESFRKKDYYSILNEVIPDLSNFKEAEFIKSPEVPTLESIIMISDETRRGTYRFQDVMNCGTKSQMETIYKIQHKIQFDEPANIQFTSGTTGNPKGATLSHHNIINNAYLLGLRLGYDKEIHRICLPVPLYHCFGTVIGVLCGSIYGAALVLPSPIFSAREAIKAVSLERCTSLYGTPAMFIDMVNHPDLKETDVTSLRTGVMAGAPCLQSVVRSVAEDLHMPDVMVAYGMTETSPITFSSYAHDRLEIRSSTIGYPADHTEVKVVNEDNEIVPVNTPGELYTRGYSTMLKYWNDKEKTEETITEDRWLRTGDVATIDENGYGQIVGRIKDMLIRGGENVYPREVEDILHTHPAVIEAHVIGVPDDRLGEEVCAWVHLRPNAEVTENQLREFCSLKMAYFKVPKHWLFRHDFPKTITGKVQKYRMRDITVADFSSKNY